MTCDEAENLISARADGELPPGDSAALALDAHMAGCAECRATADAVQVQDAALVRAFAPARRASDVVAERAFATLLAERAAPAGQITTAPSRATPPRRWVIGIAASAIAASVVLATVLFIPRPKEPVARPTFASAAPPVAQVSLSTGDVFTCPSHSTDAWRPVSPGASLAGGDRVRTGPSARVELRLADGSQVRLNGGTEARLDPGRSVELKQGQLWSAVPPGSQPLLVTAPREAGGTITATNTPGGQLDFACAPAGPVVTAIHGPARVTDGRGTETQVPPGTAMTFVAGVAAGAGAPGDPLLAMRWLDDLLMLKGRDDPERMARVNELLSRAKLEAAAAPAGSTPAGSMPPAAAPSAPGPVEQLIRSQGDRWTDSLACHVRSPDSLADRATRVAAARLLADLAPPSAIPDLIALLPDRDGEVRFFAAKALHRLTGQNLGRTPEQCATDPADEAEQTHKQWQAWWEQNQARYHSPPR